MSKINLHKCIWMEAGIVQYKLCEKEFDCEHCEFFKSLSSLSASFSGPDEKSSTGKCHLLDYLILHTEKNTYIEKFFRQLIPGLFCHLDRYYIPPFFWFLMQDSHYLMGIIPIWQILLPAKASLHVISSRLLKENEVVAKIQHEDFVIEMTAPVSLKIIQTFKPSSSYSAIPHRNLFPVWMVNLENSRVLPLYSLPVTSIVNWYIEVLRLIKQRLYLIQLDYNDFMADGGEIMSDLKQIFTPKEYRNLINDIIKIRCNKNQSK